MSDESRLEEQMIQEAIQLDAEKRKMATSDEDKKPTTQVSDNMSQPETTPPIESIKTEQPQLIVENSPQESWRYLREERERLEKRLEQERKEKEELIRYMQQNQQNQQVQQVSPEEEEYRAPDDEYMEGKHLNKSQQQMKLRIDRESKARQESEKRMYEMMVQQQLMMDLPDYRQVFTAENLDKLEKMNPDLARSLIANPDPLSKRRATYDAIKAFVIPSRNNEMKELELKAQAEKANKNFNKPIPTSSTSNSPLTKANAFSDGRLTEERKTELFEDWAKKTTSHYNFKR